MIPEVSILLVASLLGSASADQFSEVYNKESSYPTFRDPSDFEPPVPELRNEPIEGLPSYQHGYQLVNTQEAQRAQKLTDSQRETVRKQEEFLKTALESNKARSRQPVTSEYSGIQQHPSTLSPSTHKFRNLDIPETDFTSHPTFNLRTQGEPKVTPGTLHTIEFNSFQTEPALVSQGSGSVIQHVPPQKTLNSLPERRPTFAFRQQSTTPSYQQDVSGFGQDFLKTNIRQQPQHQFQQQTLQQQQQQQQQLQPQSQTLLQRQQQQQQQQPLLQQQQPQFVQHHTEVSPSHGTFNVNRRPVPSTDHRQRFSQVRIPGSEQSLVQPELDPLQRLPIAETPTPTNFQSGDDEELRFISQVNQNTAAGASQISNFQQGSQLSDFDVLPPAPTRVASTRRPVIQNLPQEDTFEANKRRKLVSQRMRKPVAPVTDQTQFGFVPTPVATVPDVPRHRPPSQNSRLEDNDTARPEGTAAELEARKQAESAKYHFASSISDTVNGNSQSRQEARDGLKLTGMYSYSDGFFKRTVYYEADENGYRIVKEENEPIGTGPEYNPDGEVQVNYQQAGSRLKYNIRGDQFKKRPAVDRKTPVISSGALDYDDQLELPA